MTEFTTIQEQVERRTYLMGKFKGKLIGYFDKAKSDLLHENFYDLEVLSGEITTERSKIRIWKEGDEFDEFLNVETFLTKLPDTLPCTVLYVDGKIKHFKINLNKPKLSKYVLSNQSYEGTNIFGDIIGDISGYLIHYDTVSKEVEVLPVSPLKIKTKKETGNIKVSGNYKSSEHYYADKSTYWGDWIYQGKKGVGAFIWSFLIGLIKLFLLLLFVLPILIAGKNIILPLLFAIVVLSLLSALRPVIIFIWNWFMRIFSFALLLLFVYGIISIFQSPIQSRVKKNYSTDDNNEVTQTKPEPQFTGDSIISHHRIWKDYTNHTYSGNLEVKVSDFRNANYFRNNLPLSIQATSQYNYIVSRISEFDKGKLARIYLMFDSLKTKNTLNQVQFAEVITSCIQDIPYTLILENACNSIQYSDDFIKNYLNNGGNCRGYVKYGLLSPIEFMGSLEGDCDTRTLLLFTILDHYNFDVAMLGSELYKHSVIAINLPFTGVSKTINGKQYVLWETTEQGIEPGLFPRELSDMRFWNVNLISNNKSI